MKIEKIDDYTVRFTFAEPYGDFLAELASPLGQHPVLYAKHYCSQFHPKYNQKIDETVKANNASRLEEPLPAEVRRHRDPGPLGQSRAADARPLGGQGALCRRRHPRRHGAQPLLLAGRSRRATSCPTSTSSAPPIAQDVESLILAAIGGRIDFGLRHLDAPANRPVLAENREKGGYELFEARSVGGTNMVINLNLTHKDQELRELFNKKDFRIALSHGIDRKSIIDTALLRRGRALAAAGRSRTTRTTTSGSRPSTSSTTPPRRTRCSTSSASTSAGPTACACCRAAGPCSSRST